MDEAEKPKRKRNWWKIGCITALVLLELSREIIVVQGDGSAQPAVSKYISEFRRSVSATGRWWRVNDDSEIVPGVVRIECNPETRECIEVSTSIYDRKYVMEPEINHFPATWDQTSVSYVNDDPECARYSVRIDWVTKRASATRIRKDNPANTNCSKLEAKLEMELGDGYKSDEHDKEMDSHFVPIIQLLIGAVKLFD